MTFCRAVFGSGKTQGVDERLGDETASMSPTELGLVDQWQEWMNLLEENVDEAGQLGGMRSDQTGRFKLPGRTVRTTTGIDRSISLSDQSLPFLFVDPDTYRVGRFRTPAFGVCRSPLEQSGLWM